SLVVSDLLTEDQPRADRLQARADDVLAGCLAAELAGTSDMLPSGLTRRLSDLAGALRDAAAAPGPGEAPDPAAAQAVERAWDLVRRHRLADRDHRVPPFHAAVRLIRWLAVPPGGPAGDLVALARRHGEIDGWVDSAVNDAVGGVS